MPSEKVLIVDDEKLVRWSLRQKCEEWGYHVLEADNGSAALRVAHNESPDLVLLDVRLPDASGIEMLEQLKKSGDARAVIMITADPQLEDVKTALKLGAYDFVGKPLDFDELAVAVKNALETTRLRSEVESLRGEMRRRTGYHNVIGVSQKMSELLGFVNKIASQRGHHDPGTGRKRHWQGPDREGHSLPEPPAGEAVCRYQLLGHSRNPDGSRTVRPRTRRLYRRQGHEEGPLRDGRRRNAVSRRNRRALTVAASQVAARAGRPGDSPRGRRARHASGCARDRRF